MFIPVHIVATHGLEIPFWYQRGQMCRLRPLPKAVWASTFRCIFIPKNLCPIWSISINTHFDHVFPPGDFQFSVSSDDNSEFWLSPDESPLNARLLVYVGQVSTVLHSCKMPEAERNPTKNQQGASVIYSWWFTANSPITKLSNTVPGFN